MMSLSTTRIIVLRCGEDNLNSYYLLLLPATSSRDGMDSPGPYAQHLVDLYIVPVAVMGVSF